MVHCVKVTTKVWSLKVSTKTTSFSAPVRHAELDAKKTVPGSSKLQLWTNWTITSGLPCLGGVPCWSPKRLMSWKSSCRPSEKSCHKNTSTRRWWTSPSAGLPTWPWLPMMVSSSICSNSVLFIYKSASSSYYHQTDSFHSHQQTTGKDNAWNAEEWGLSWLK